MAVHPLQFSPEGNLSRRLHPVELDHPGPLICIRIQDGPQAEGGVLHPLPGFIQVSPILLRQVLVRKLDIVPGLPDQALLRLAGVGEQALVDVQQEAGGVADGAVMVPAPQLLRGTAPSPPGSWPQRTGGAPPPCRGGYGPSGRGRFPRSCRSSDSSKFSSRACQREQPSQAAYSWRNAIRRLPRFRLGRFEMRRKSRSS